MTDGTPRGMGDAVDLRGLQAQRRCMHPMRQQELLYGVPCDLWEAIWVVGEYEELVVGWDIEGLLS